MIDGADEVGVDSVLELLAEARLLANTWPNTRIVVTTRPIGFPLAADELIRIEPLSEDSVDQIIERIIGRPVTGGERASWPDSIRSAINRPLFAVLMGIHLQEPHSHSPKSIAELLDWMIRASLGGHKETSGKIDEALQSIAVLSTSRTNSPIPAAEVSAIGPLQDLLNSRLVVSDGNLISFPLPIVTQWFAAKAILNKKVPIEQITSDRKLLESWYYPLVIALGLADHEQASSILKPLAKLHPSVAAMVADEALARSGMETDVKPPPFQESGRRIREAMQAWVDGIGPLKSLIAPLRQDGSLPPIGVAINDAWLDAGWYFGTEAIPDVVELPAAARPFGPGAPGWHFYRGARPGRQPSWAWRWALEKLRENLAEFVRKAALPISEGPLHHEKIWELVLVLAGKGSLHYQPVPLTKVEERITLFGTHGPKLILNGHRIDLDEMRGEIARLRHEGKTDFQPVWPSPNRNGGRWIWSGYTDQQVVARANAVFEGALNGYELLIQRWFPQLAPRMELAALLPVKVVGYVAMEHEEPHAAWHLEPLPKGSKSKAEFQLAPANQNPAIAHGETLKGIVPKVHALRPEIAEWYSYTYHHGGLEVFQVRSATELAYRWLESDLRRLSWIG
ncbi:MAG: hypothetical protein M0D55_15115 [Elusimicrobiota bacterium]|nr:MAG: hypothetical protein M0D55_15115 [Elusimicrobiota bacterium]